MNAEEEHARIDAEIDRVEKSTDPFAAAVRATRMPMLITDPNKPDNPIVFANNAFSRLTGYSREEVIGRNCRFLQGPATDRAAVARLRDAIRRRAEIELEIVNHRKDGSTFWNRVLISPVFDETGRLSYFFASQFDVTLERERIVRLEDDRQALEREIERRTRDLRQADERMRYMMTAARLGSWSLDLRDMRLVCSDICKKLFGRFAGQPFTYEDLLAAIVDEDRGGVEQGLSRSFETGQDYESEFRILTPAGETRWILLRGRPHRGPDDIVTSMSGMTIDITDSKRNEEQRLILTAELKHRVKNSMATVQSMVTQSLRNAPSMTAARRTVTARLQSMATAHDLLTRENWNSATIPEIVAAATKPFEDGHGHRFQTHGLDLKMPPRATMALMLSLHELATNAVKYGALSRPDGHVVIDWMVFKNAAEDHLELRWHEFGGPAIDGPPSTRGFGSKLIETVLAAEMEGEATIEYRPAGVVFKLVAPVPNQDKIATAAEDETFFRRHMGE